LSRRCKRLGHSVRRAGNFEHNGWYFWKSMSGSSGIRSRHCARLILMVSLSHSISGVATAGHVRTALSKPALVRRCPSGLNATLRTALECPVSGAPSGSPVSAFHNRTVPSSLAVARRTPSRLNTTASTLPPWRESLALTESPVAVSHNLTDPSWPPAAMRCPSSLFVHATEGAISQQNEAWMARGVAAAKAGPAAPTGQGG
jgi:hypothetical protein